MTAAGRIAVSRMVPVLNYRDPAAAIEWLSSAFGFEKQTVVSGADGAFQYALMRFGDAVVMLARDIGTASGSDGDPNPRAVEPASFYFVVENADTHCARAKVHGAEIIADIGTMDHGGRGYSCRDGEGHVWSFGTYDPLEGQGNQDLRPPIQPTERLRRGKKRWALLSGLAAAIVGSAVAAAWIQGVPQEDAREAEEAVKASVRQLEDEVIRERRARQAAERALSKARSAAPLQIENGDGKARVLVDTRQSLDRERGTGVAAERAAREAEQRSASERAGKDALERAAAAARADADRARGAKESAERALGDAEKRLEAAQKEGEAAEVALQEAQALYASTQSARAVAERAGLEARAQADREREARETLERVLKEVNIRFASEKTARQAAERASQEALAEVDSARKSKEEAWKLVARMRRQGTRSASTQSGIETPPENPGVPQAAQRPAKTGEPQYNGPLSPF